MRVLNNLHRPILIGKRRRINRIYDLMMLLGEASRKGPQEIHYLS